MKNRSQAAFTVIELICIIVIIALVAFFLLPAISHSRPRGKRINCVSNLKQIGLGYRMFANDHNDLFPNEVTTNSDRFAGMLSAAESFKYLDGSNDYFSTKQFVCPADASRDRATNLSTLSNSNLSYFSCLNASQTNPSMFLTGDRNLTLNGASLPAFTVNTNDVLGWTTKLHNTVGNVGLTDGSVQQCTQNKLTELMRASGSVHRLSLP